MKNVASIIILMLTLSFGLYAQPRKFRDTNAMKKIEELEKIKLIESLKMNEETTLRFFARWDKFKDDQHNIIENINNLVDKMDQAVTNSNDDKNPEVKKMIKDYFDMESQLQKNRRNFINSLNDILTQTQIAKLLVFEKKFKDEIRNVLFYRQRMHGPMN